MLSSIASKRAIPIVVPGRGNLGKAVKQRHRAKRLTTASTSASASPSTTSISTANYNYNKNTNITARLAVSRRAWLGFKESRGIRKKAPDPSKKSASSNDEKPWPRNMQIAACVAGAIAVPYTIVWTITSNPTLREWFGPILPLDRLRTFFGKLEWDARSYTEEMEDARARERNGESPGAVQESLIGYYQFPEEDPFRVRQQNEIIEAMSESDVAVTLSATSSSSSSSQIMENIVTKTVVANTIANEKTLLELFSNTNTNTNTNTTNDAINVAVDFLDHNNPDSKIGDNDNDNDTIEMTTEPLSDGSLMTDTESMAKTNYSRGCNTTSTAAATNKSQQLARETQTMSKWSYTPSQDQQQQQQGSGGDGAKGAASASGMTDVERRMGELEHVVSELEKNLRDPMCTRSIDDMTSELSTAKRELSRLKWKRRFGLV